MFSANGKFICKEGFDEPDEIKNINKNSHLFYDADGALRSSIMISEYGDFTISTNYGSIKQKMSLNSDGTLRTSGKRLCLEDVCLNKDDILKLKQLDLTDSFRGRSSDTVTSEQQEELEIAIQEKTSLEIEISEVSANISAINEIVELARQTLLQAQNELSRVEDDVEELNQEIEEEQAQLTLANNNLLEAQDNGASAEVIESLTEIANSQNAQVNSLIENLSSAEASVEQAVITKNSAETDLELRIEEQNELNQTINTLRDNLTTVEETIDSFSS